MSKFENIAAEAAYAIAGHGFEDRQHGSTQDIGWNAVTSLNAVTLLNVGENDLSDRFRAEFGERTIEVWVRENSVGFVDAFKVALYGTLDADWTKFVLANPLPDEFGFDPETGWTGR